MKGRWNQRGSRVCPRRIVSMNIKRRKEKKITTRSRIKSDEYINLIQLESNRMRGGGGKWRKRGGET